ncbi:CoA pyrophosphatase [SAR116 cluster bacterium]|nr:CoA pyrophosphatase [SAR116 cluster bacterium]
MSFNKISSSAKKSAVMCLFLEKNNKIYLILTKRSEKLNHHAGEISFPGGSLENQDKNSLMAAFRETYEEIGIPESRINVIGQLDDYITGTGFHIETYVGIIKKNTIFRVNKEEVTELIFLPIEVLQNETNIIWTSKKFGNKSYNFWKIKFLNYNIWGATASILANLSVKVWDTKLQRAI